MPPLILNGLGRLVSNVGNHNADPRNFTVLKDLFTDAAGRIRKRPGIGVAKGAAAPAAVPSMHEYVYTHPSTGVETRWLFRATAATIQFYDRGANSWTTITWPSGYVASAGGLWVFENVPIGATAWCLAVNGKDDMIYFDGTSWYVAGVDGPASALGYQLGGIYGFGGSFGTLTTVNCTKGSKNITGVGGTVWLTFAEGPVPAGARIEINGNAYTIETVTADTGITLTEQFKEETAAGLPYQIFYGSLSWNRQVRAAYAYYNETTGHVSNIRAASVTNQNITETTEQNQTGRKLTWNNIVYSPTAFAQGYTKIRLFRSPKDAVILQALDTTVNNSSGAGSTTFSETASTFVDTYLLPWEASTTRYAKPPTAAIAVKYHQGRVFLLTRTRLYYSLHEVEVVGQLGVAALSWPATQWISVNQPRGLLLLGNGSADATLVVQTAGGDYAVIGYDVRTLALVKLPTRTTETFQYGAIATEGRLVSFDVDLRLRDSEGNDFGGDIQDKLDGVRASLVSGARLHRFTSKSDDYVLLSVPKASGSTTNDVTYVLDLDSHAEDPRPRWYEWTVGFTALCTAKNPTTLERELWASNSLGETFLLLQAATWQDKGVDFTPSLKTSILWPQGEFADTDFQEIQAFTSNAALSWAGEFLIKGQSDGSGQAFTLAVPRHHEKAMPQKVDWKPTLTPRTKAQAFQITITFPTSNADLYLEQIALLFEGATAGR